MNFFSFVFHPPVFLGVTRRSGKRVQHLVGHFHKPPSLPNMSMAPGLRDKTSPLPFRIFNKILTYSWKWNGIAFDHDEQAVEPELLTFQVEASAIPL